MILVAQPAHVFPAHTNDFRHLGLVHACDQGLKDLLLTGSKGFARTKLALRRGGRDAHRVFVFPVVLSCNAQSVLSTP